MGVNYLPDPMGEKKGRARKISGKNREWRKKVLNYPKKSAGVVEKKICTPGIILADVEENDDTHRIIDEC